jgi:16S rRNA (cytosine967-C5)-methyltransferase
VQAAVALKAQGLKGLVNACLRNFMRNKDRLIEKTNNTVTQFNHPSWFIKRIQAAYPVQWQEILEQNLQRAPMWLRVHTRNQSTDKFIDALNDAKIEFETHPNNPTAIRLLTPKPVEKIPGFADGWFVVQDAAAQNAGLLLGAQDGETILDACAAPGGKTCHVMDTANVKMVAADIDETRLTRVKDNLTRLKLDAQMVCGDLSDANALKDYPQFDRILLDAPCSATGVIRRHPDIKWLRRNEDIAQLSQLQADILERMWDKLKPGGILLYATCSILPNENKQQMVRFLAEHKDATLVPINSEPSVAKIDVKESNDNPGWQILPGEHNMDGFYYCRLKKS